MISQDVKVVCSDDLIYLTRPKHLLLLLVSALEKLNELFIVKIQVAKKLLRVLLYLDSFKLLMLLLEFSEAWLLQILLHVSLFISNCLSQLMMVKQIVWPGII